MEEDYGHMRILYDLTHNSESKVLTLTLISALQKKQKHDVGLNSIHSVIYTSVKKEHPLLQPEPPLLNLLFVHSLTVMILLVLRQVKIWFQNRRMKWKRSHKAKEQKSPLTDTEKAAMDIHSAKPQSDSHSSSLEDEEEIEGDDEDEKEEVEVLRAASLGSVGFSRHAGGGTGNYYSEEEPEEECPRTRSGIFP